MVKRKKGKTNDKLGVEDTPRTKTRKLLRNFDSKKSVRKTLVYHNTLIHELRQSYINGGRKFKKNIATMLSGRLIKKYQLLSYVRDDIGLKRMSYKKNGENCKILF